MKINEILAEMDSVIVSGRITYIGIRRTVKTRYGEASVATAVLEDETGKIALNLWRDQIDLVKDGDLVQIENGFVKTYQDKLELNVGSRGKIVLISRNKSITT